MENKKKGKKVEFGKYLQTDIFNLFFEPEESAEDRKQIEKKIIEMIESDRELFINIASVNFYPN